MSEITSSELIEYRRINSLSQKDLAEALDVSLRTIQYWEKGERPIVGPARILLNHMLKSSTANRYSNNEQVARIGDDESEFYRQSSSKSNAKPLGNMQVMRIPVVTQYAYAGYLSGYADPEYLEELPYIYIMVDREYKGRYQGFQVRGDSMYDGTDESISEGDIAVGRNVAQHHWQSKLHIRRWDFVIVHKEEGILVKRITDHNVDRGTITAHSLNSYYEDRTFRLDEIAELWNVVKIVKEK